MSEEDFQVIDETVLLECDRVRMVPRQQPGRLALLRLKDNAYCFEWTSEAMDETEPPRRIPLNEGLLVVPDEDSSTLLLLLPESKGVCWLFHFLAGGSPEAFARQATSCKDKPDNETLAHEQFKDTHARPQSSDLAFNVFAGFAKVKQTYGRLLGFGRPKARPPRQSTGIPRNPWIREDAIPKLPPSRRIPTPISPLIWKSFHEEDGSLVDQDNVNQDNLLQLIHCSGVEEGLRAEAWRYVLGLRSAGMSDEQYQVHLEGLQGDFQRILERLFELETSDPEMMTKLRERIDKDVFRTDRTLPFYHPSPTTIEQDLRLENLRRLQQLLLAYYVHDPELDYVQGMADLLSPILYVLHSDESEAFWTFVHLMKRQRGNFLPDSPAISSLMIQTQELIRLLDPLLSDFLSFHSESSKLFFCYRWFLVLFKREFAFDDTLRAWETIITAPLSDAPYEVYIAAALLDLSKRDIMEQSMGFGETLAHLSEMSHAIPIGEILERADQIHRLFTQDSRLQWLYRNAISSAP